MNRYKAKELKVECEKYYLRGVEVFVGKTAQELSKAFNGVGPEWFSPDARKVLDAISADIMPAVFIHDCEYAFSDGSLENFTVANDNLLHNGKVLAKAKYKWYHPRRYRLIHQTHLFHKLCAKWGWKAYKDAFAAKEDGSVSSESSTNA